ncbi:alpha-tocopherol transfer protein-like [Trichonephila inaurata madagascariensis]|uniref:Alpha-tocopherol transfer protein-like n=1 Tax=Trichonephila inaurata madagascariensis TaxID=2747483 RepID=A0A8X6Y9S2_9ARAC|nr:alpha-tocopherol transfer protein-like [Trichonephila inaurata madagascariensis]
MRCFVPRYVPLIAKILRNSLPIRFKGIHIVNEGIVFRYAWAFFRHLLSEKIKNRQFKCIKLKQQLKQRLYEHNVTNLNSDIQNLGKNATLELNENNILTQNTTANEETLEQ